MNGASAAGVKSNALHDVLKCFEIMLLQAFRAGRDSVRHAVDVPESWKLTAS